MVVYRIPPTAPPEWLGLCSRTRGFGGTRGLSNWNSVAGRLTVKLDWSRRGGTAGESSNCCEGWVTDAALVGTRGGGFSAATRSPSSPPPLLRWWTCFTGGRGTVGERDLSLDPPGATPTSCSTASEFVNFRVFGSGLLSVAVGLEGVATPNDSSSGTD